MNAQNIFPAIASGNTVVVRVIVASHINSSLTAAEVLTSARDDLGRTALHVAAKHGDPRTYSIVDTLIQNYELTPFFSVPGMIRFLLGDDFFPTEPGAREAFLSAVSPIGDHAMIWSMRSGQVDAICELYAQGLQIFDLRNYLGSSAIHISTSLVDHAMLATLIDLGADVNSTNAMAGSPLSLAVHREAGALLAFIQ